MKNYTIKSEKWALVDGKLTTISESTTTVQAETVWQAFSMVEGDAKQCVKVDDIVPEPEPVEISCDFEECFEVAPIAAEDIEEQIELAEATAASAAEFRRTIWERIANFRPSDKYRAVTLYTPERLMYYYSTHQ